MLNPEVGIVRRPVITDHALNCPACSNPVFVAHSTRSEVPSGKNWLSDGDAVVGVYDALSEHQKSANAFSCMLLVGTCLSCELHYFVVEASIMPKHPDADAYLNFNTPFDAEKNYVCSTHSPLEIVPQSWLQQEYATPIGVMRHNVFGPYSLPRPHRVVGENGLNGCEDKLLNEDSPWDFAKALLVTLWDRLAIVTDEKNGNANGEVAIPGNSLSMEWEDLSAQIVQAGLDDAEKLIQHLQQAHNDGLAIEKPYAYDVPDEVVGGRTLSYAGWFQQSGNELPKSAFPLYRSAPITHRIQATLGLVPKWRDQLQADHPKSESEQWPIDLIGSYMAQEIGKYRALAGAAMQGPIQVDLSDSKIDAIFEAYEAKVKRTYEYDPSGFWRGFARELLAASGSKDSPE